MVERTKETIARLREVLHKTSPADSNPVSKKQNRQSTGRHNEDFLKAPKGRDFSAGWTWWNINSIVIPGDGNVVNLTVVNVDPSEVEVAAAPITQQQAHEIEVLIKSISEDAQTIMDAPQTIEAVSAWIAEKIGVPGYRDIPQNRFVDALRYLHTRHTRIVSEAVNLRGGGDAD